MRHLPLPDAVESIEVDVGQQRRDHSPLRRSRDVSPSPCRPPSPRPPATAASASAPDGPRSAASPAPSRFPGRSCRSSSGCRRPRRIGGPGSHAARIASSASVALRFGRNPYEHSWKSASKIGSITSFAAICTTRSRTVGIPSGRCFPSAFGMYRRRTGRGRYPPSRRSRCIPVETPPPLPARSPRGSPRPPRRPPDCS